MEMRVEQLSARSGQSVDTIRYYQSKGLLEPPRRQGRVAWYNAGHLDRLGRIRSLQQRGFTLATIARLVSGDLDEADEALLGELTAAPTDQVRGLDPLDLYEQPTGQAPAVGMSDETFTIAELAEATGVPMALLQAIEAEGLLVPRRVGSSERYTAEDVAASRAGLLLLEWGIPLSALLELARRHHEATEVVAREAVAMFSTYVRGPGRIDHHAEDGGTPPAPDIDRLVRAYSELLPAVTTLVGHHFTRTLVKVALEQVEDVGSAAEQQAVWDQVELAAGSRSPAGPADPTGPFGAGSRRRQTASSPS